MTDKAKPLTIYDLSARYRPYQADLDGALYRLRGPGLPSPGMLFESMSELKDWMAFGQACYLAALQPNAQPTTEGSRT